MKVLLVGFSSLSANVLSAWIGQAYKSHHVVTIERSFDDNLRLCLPNLKETHNNALAMIINMEGIGMMNFSQKNVQILTEFIGNRTALLIGKNELNLWRNAQTLPKDFIMFTHSPYTKNEILPKLEKLIKNTYLVRKSEPVSEVSYKISENPSVNNTPPKPETQLSTSYQDEGNFLYHIIKQYFKTKQTGLLYAMLGLRISETPLKVTIGKHHFYVNSQKNMGLVCDVEKLIEYCELSGNFCSKSSIISYEKITNEEFEAIMFYIPKNGYRKYALGTLIWQIYTKLLPKDLEMSTHNLQLKIKYMPNFSQMADVPDYVRHVLSACLVTPKTLLELGVNLEAFGDIDNEKLNKVFLVAMLSGFCDHEVLKTSFENKEIHKEHSDTNMGIKKAQKSGFLKRFLSKLSLSLT